MSLVAIKAHFTCDDCGAAFSVEMDAANDMPAGWSMYDHAVDACRSSVGYEDEDQAEGIASSVDGDQQFCKACTQRRDEARPDEEEDGDDAS